MKARRPSVSDGISVKVYDVTGEMKIRDYLTRRLGFSTSLIAKVKYGGVRVNGEVVFMRHSVKEGDTVSVDFPTEESENIEPMDIPLEILYEDEHILAVNKPINMPVHPAKGNHLPTLANAVRHHIGHPFVFRAVNRLDRDTSGIVLIAKDQLSSAILSRSLRLALFEKKYRASVVGIPSPSEGEISAPIVREAEGSIRRTVREDGKQSLTKYKVISVDKGGNAYCEITPVTGRTHQIRVHMAYIGHPLVGDFLYGERIEGKTYKLHCCELKFPHPTHGEQTIIVADDPPSAKD